MRARWQSLAIAAFAVSLPAGASAARRAEAVRTTTPIEVDGRLTEADWSTAPVQHGFSQLMPSEGQPAGNDTEFRVLFDDTSLYIGVRAHEDHPREMRGLLTRRDADSVSDWITVSIDSYNDKRTAFAFALNAAGVQADLMIFDNVHEDASWNAVWEGATSTDEGGWVAEFRVPFNQLRFARREHHEWGIQVQRFVPRTGELSYWSPVLPRNQAQVVSLFGRVGGISRIAPARRLELMPYAAGGVRLPEAAADDPFGDEASEVGGVGLDFRYGLTSNLTVSGAINPDFRQVEADPSELNLTASETFFAEKRPFFLEGVDIFRCGLGTGEDPEAVEQLFYTRRIGAAPHATGHDVAEYVDEEQTTSIYGAAKVSGKTSNGWKVGALAAATSEETARVQTMTGEIDEVVIEPLAVYGTVQLGKDFQSGRSSLGAVGTVVERRVDGTGLDWLHDHAYAGGVMGSHRSQNGAFAVDANLLGSYVQGNPAAIDRTQRSSLRYFQRPGAGYLGYDPTATSLAGLSAQTTVTHVGGRHWRTSLGVEGRSPGFEVNDLGFQRTADTFTTWASTLYREDRADDLARRWNVKSKLWSSWTWEPQHLGVGASASVDTLLASYWGMYAGASVAVDQNDPRLLRGGPAVAGLARYDGYVGLTSDERRRLHFGLQLGASTQPESSSERVTVAGVIALQARSNLEIVASPSFTRGTNALQYVDTIDDLAGTPHYLLARADETTAALQFRVNYTLTPRLSLQAYAEPFIAAASYREYKEAAQARREDYESQFHRFKSAELMEEPDEIAIDREVDGVIDYRVSRPDFNLRALRASFVSRWEYRPGSALFLIWSHDRQSAADDGRFRLGPDVRDLASRQGEHIFLVKLSYWWAP